jgi:Spy/CpxP family protein refolding chaperone
VRWTALCGFAFALCGGAAFAQPGPPPPGEPPGIERILERNAERLHLEGATLEKIRALAAAGRDKAEPLHEEVRRRHEEMHALLSADNPDADAVMAKAEEIGRAETAAQKERLHTMLAIRALLTVPQRRELVKIHEEWRAAHPEAGERGWHRWRDHGGRE